MASCPPLFYRSTIAGVNVGNNLSINVYGIEDDKKVIYPYLDLLLYECNGIQHYTTIKNVSRLVSSQLSNDNCATYCCKKCLYGYSTKELLDAHAKDCCHAQRTKFPKDPRCRFTNIRKQLPTPLVVFADFESILKPVNEDVTQGVDTDIESSCHVFQEHIPYSFAYNIVSSVDTGYSRPLVLYTGEDAAVMCVRKLQLSSCLMNISLLQNQCCLLLQNHDHLPKLPSAIYVQNYLKMIKCGAIVTLLGFIVVCSQPV